MAQVNLSKVNESLAAKRKGIQAAAVAKAQMTHRNAIILKTRVTGRAKLVKK